MKYRKKPIAVEVEQWFQGQSVAGVEPFADSDSRVERAMMDALPWGTEPEQYGYIWTLEGGHVVTPGDWIVTGPSGEKWPVKDAIFRTTYETVSEDTPEPAREPELIALIDVIDPSLKG